MRKILSLQIRSNRHLPNLHASLIIVQLIKRYNIMQLIKNTTLTIYIVRRSWKAAIASGGTNTYFNVFSFTSLIELRKCFKKFFSKMKKNCEISLEKKMLAFFKILSRKTFETRFAIKGKKIVEMKFEEANFWKLWSTNIKTSCFLFHHCLSFCLDVKKNNNKIVLRDCVRRETTMLCGHTITTILRHEGLESQYGKMEKVPLID